MVRKYVYKKERHRDKTGTLTKAEPTVLDIVSFNGMKCKELLRIAGETLEALKIHAARTDAAWFFVTI